MGSRTGSAVGWASACTGGAGTELGVGPSRGGGQLHPVMSGGSHWRGSAVCSSGSSWVPGGSTVIAVATEPLNIPAMSTPAVAATAVRW